MTWPCWRRMDAGAWKRIRFQDTGVIGSLRQLLNSSPCLLRYWSTFPELCPAKAQRGVVPVFEHLVLFNEENLSLGVEKNLYAAE